MNRQPLPFNKKEIKGVSGGLDLRSQLDPKYLSWDIFLFGAVEDDKMAETVQHIITLDQTNMKKPINLLMNSPGGDCSAGYALIDVMMSSRHPIRTIALGEVCSMGALIFIAGYPSQRFIGSRAMVLFHPVRDLIEDYSQYIKDRVKAIDYLEDTSAKLMRARTKLPEKLIEKSLNGELWLSPSEAVKYGVADHLIEDSKLDELIKADLPKAKSEAKDSHAKPKSTKT